LVDAWTETGLEGLAQVDLDVRQDRQRPFEELGPTADAALASVMTRAHREGRIADAASWPERPPVRTYDASLAGV